MRQVHVTDRDGAGVFNRLYDSGSDRMELQSGLGWVSKAECVRNGWVVRDGWKEHSPAES
jgi:hypothetical protein